MEIKKQVIQIGDSLGIILDKVIVENLQLKKGDMVDISDIVKIE